MVAVIGILAYILHICWIFLHIFRYLLLLLLSLKYSDIIYVSKDFYINAIVLSFGNCPCWLL